MSVARGPVASSLLRRLGIDPKRYWLLTDLFDKLSERGEIMDQLGREGVALKSASWLYLVMSVLMSVAAAAGRSAPAETFSLGVLLLTTLIVTGVLMSETANSLANPSEGMVLAHQPIGGATYTAAKLTHLARIVMYLVPALNAVPSLAILALKGARWYHPLVHFFAAVALGLLAALLCCAVFGWLLRFVPVQRLKGAGQLASTLPLLALMWGPSIQQYLRGRQWLPADASARWLLLAVCLALAVTVVVVGLRALSYDYLVRVAGLTRGGATHGAKARRSGIGQLAARRRGGQAGRAGFVFVSRLMLRDWQFRRQFVPPFLAFLLIAGQMIWGGWRTDPFSGSFSTMHIVPHLFGLLAVMACATLQFGSDYKGSWIFLASPSRALDGFARGVHTSLWTRFALVPNLVVLPLLVWAWGWAHAAMFAAYGIAACSLYVALAPRLVEGVPFTKPFDSARGATLMPAMMGSVLAVAAAVGLQHFFVFRRPAGVVAATIALGLAAAWATGRTLAAFAAEMRFQLGIESAESGTLYREVMS